jgi:hypothetical protein
MIPVLFKDVITASDRTDGHKFGTGFFSSEKSHAYWFHGFQFICNGAGKIGMVISLAFPPCLWPTSRKLLTLFATISFVCSTRTFHSTKAQNKTRTKASFLTALLGP